MPAQWICSLEPVVNAVALLTVMPPAVVETRIGSASALEFATQEGAEAQAVPKLTLQALVPAPRPTVTTMALSRPSTVAAVPQRAGLGEVLPRPKLPWASKIHKALAPVPICR